MSVDNQRIAKESSTLPKAAVAVLLAVLAFGVFMVGFDQGEVLGFTVPPDGSGGHPGNNWAHEFYHDMRHAAGIPCH
ncbi:MAG: CbtB-domain containing protein [Nitrososphaera sp.]|nr:CbtB-domain containing protein [Nitrososphaera sp.]